MILLSEVKAIFLDPLKSELPNSPVKKVLKEHRA